MTFVTDLIALHKKNSSCEGQLVLFQEEIEKLRMMIVSLTQKSIVRLYWFCSNTNNLVRVLTGFKLSHTAYQTSVGDDHNESDSSLDV